ncbi:hypothetical protein YQE_08722, partial [Dendroctonus ponderosae]
MFGGVNVEPPRCKQFTKRDSNRQDILAPSITPGYFAHFARQPNSNNHVQMIQYQQQKEAFEKAREDATKQQMIKNATEIKFENHAQKKRYQRSLENKVKEKWKAYEATIEARRERNLCQELRPSLIKKRLMESKYSQLQQIRENEARREADRELDKMWHELAVKEVEAKKEREVQEMLERRNKEKEMLSVWEKQIKGNELLREEIGRVAQEDRLEMQKLSEQLRREEIEALDKKRRKRDEAAKQILEQIEIQKQLHDQRKKEENALEQAFTTLAQLEIERERSSMQNAAENARRETAMYRQHLKQLDDERKLEEKKLMELLEMHRKEVEEKQNAARCKIIEAKRQLQKDVLAERANQINYKQLEAEQQLKLKEAENELLRMAYETNERLQAESDRLERQAALQYRQDLKRQIDYNTVLRKREREELERQLAEGAKEEEKYKKIVEQMLSGEIEITAKHPFRKAIEKHDCLCPIPN